MKTSELIKLLNESLANYGDREVIMASDAEGNNYSPLVGFWEGAYVAETTYSGEAYLDELTAEDREHGYTEEDVRADAPKAIFLKPTN